jgi:hypothetical protein
MKRTSAANIVVLLSFGPAKAGRFERKIGIVRRMKSNNVAPQLSEKRIAKVTEN